MTLTEVANLVAETMRKNNDKLFGIRVDNYEYRDGEVIDHWDHSVSFIVPDNEAALREVLEFPGSELHLITFDSAEYSIEKQSFVTENPTVVTSWEIFDSLDDPQATFLEYTEKFNKLMDEARVSDEVFATYDQQFSHLRRDVERYIETEVNPTPDFTGDNLLVLYDEDLHREVMDGFTTLVETIVLAEILSDYYDDKCYFN